MVKKIKGNGGNKNEIKYTKREGIEMKRNEKYRKDKIRKRSRGKKRRKLMRRKEMRRKKNRKKKKRKEKRREEKRREELFHTLPSLAFSVMPYFFSQLLFNSFSSIIYVICFSFISYLFISFIPLFYHSSQSFQFHQFHFILSCYDSDFLLIHLIYYSNFSSSSSLLLSFPP